MTIKESNDGVFKIIGNQLRLHPDQLYQPTKLNQDLSAVLGETNVLAMVIIIGARLFKQFNKKRMVLVRE